MSLHTGVNLGPLTTVFTPPSRCTANLGQSQGQTCILSGGVATSVDDPSCWPSVTITPAPTAQPLQGWGYYSPGLECPSDYFTACLYDGDSDFANYWTFQFPPQPSETAVGCCPLGFDCSLMPDGQQTCVNEIVVEDETSVFTCSSTAMVLAPRSTAESLFAPMIQLNYQSADLTAYDTSDDDGLTNTPYTPYTEPAYPTNTQAPNTYEGSESSSSPTAHPVTHSTRRKNIVGPVVGSIGGFLVLLGIALAFLARHKRFKKQAALLTNAGHRLENAGAQMQSYSHKAPFETTRPLGNNA